MAIVLLVVAQAIGVAARPAPRHGGSGAALAQDGETLADAERLTAEMLELYKEERYAEATPLMNRALAIREKALGREHPDVVASLNSLAELYIAQGQYAKAEPLALRALAIDEKALGPDHPLLVGSLNGLAELYIALGQYAKAEPLYVRVLAIDEKTVGPEHPDVVTSLNSLAGLYYSQGQYAKAEPLYVRALAIREKALGREHPDVATSLNNLAGIYYSQGQYAEAEPLYVGSLAIREKALGREHPDVAASLNNLAVLYRAQGHYAKAEPLYVRALAIREKALGPGDPDVATSLNNLAGFYSSQGHYAKAEPLYVRALAIREKALGREHADVAGSLNNLAELYRAQGHYAKAEPLYVRALAIYENALGPEHPLVATILNNLAGLYSAQGHYAKAEPLYMRSLAIKEAALGPEHPATAGSLNSLAGLYRAQGQHSKAEPLYVRALAIREKSLGREHPDVAASLNGLGELYSAQGQYAKAEPLHMRALAIKEKAVGPEHPLVATSLNNLAVLYRAQGHYAKAEPLYVRALAMREKVLGREHPDVGEILNNLALLYRGQGQYSKAEPLYVRALAIYENALGAEHPSVAVSLNNLGELYRAQGHYAKAEPLYVRALAMREKALGREHPLVATSLNNLGELYSAQGQYAKAEPLYVRALAIYEKALGPEHPSVATSLSNLAGLYDDQGQYAKAEPLYVRALAIREKAFGPEHPYVATSLNSLGVLHLGRGDVPAAIQMLARAGAAREAELRRNIVSGSADAKRLYVLQTAYEADWALTAQLLAGPADAAATRLGLEQILRRKGRALDALVDQIGALSRSASPEDRQLLDQLAAARAELARITLAGPGEEGVGPHRARLAKASTRVDTLEAEVSARSARARAELAPVALDAVRAAVPAGFALVEFAAFDQRDPKTGGVKMKRYVAWVLLPEGRPSWVDLGEAEKIDDAVAAFRSVLRQKKDASLADVEAEVKPRARELDALVFEPVRKLLASRSTRLLIAPDGQLSLVPFDALVDEGGRFAAEAFEISYLTSGRDLLRLQARGESRSEVGIVADPDFGAAPAGAALDRTLELGSSAAVAADVAKDSMSSVLARAVFNRLPGTAEEARELKALLPDARVLTGASATKREVLALAGPRVLHVATHGFFLAGERASPEGARGLMHDNGAPPRAPGTATEDPLLRSGLALAGASLGPDGDGILTSLEAAGLDLWGTKLVVLSACDTGVGDVRNGDGVYGLRRALVLAGAETQVMSLWPVSDEGTRELMVGYYRRLVAGEGRSKAMRQQRLEMLEDAKRSHPYYWASFIISGAWDPLTPR